RRQKLSDDQLRLHRRTASLGHDRRGCRQAPAQGGIPGEDRAPGQLRIKAVSGVWLRLPMLIIGLAVFGYFLLSLCLWRWQARFIFYPTQTIGQTPTDMGVAYEPLSIPVEVEGGIQNLDGWWLPAERSGSKAILYLHGNGENITIPTYVAQAVRMRSLGLSV